MHEWGIACDLVRRVEDEGRSRGARRITVVKVRIGSLSGVVAEALRFGFEAAASGTIVLPDALACEAVAAEAVCTDCARRFSDPDGLELCPGCGSAAKRTVTGTEMEMVSFTMEADDV